MENIFGLTTCVAIVVIAYLIGIAVKNIEAIDDKWIPVICGVVGAPLGVLALHIVPDFPATSRRLLLVSSPALPRPASIRCLSSFTKTTDGTAIPKSCKPTR